MSSTRRPQPMPRSHLAQFQTITTRWADNDVYGHVNNVVNKFLIEAGACGVEPARYEP